MLAIHDLVAALWRSTNARLRWIASRCDHLLLSGSRAPAVTGHHQMRRGGKDTPTQAARHLRVSSAGWHYK
jgi:hypothetical protein